jgi:hypothetical protein
MIRHGKLAIKSSSKPVCLEDLTYLLHSGEGVKSDSRRSTRMPFASAPPKGSAKSFIKEARTGFASTSSLLIHPLLHFLQTHLTVTSGPIHLTSSLSAPNCASVSDCESKPPTDLRSHCGHACSTEVTFCRQKMQVFVTGSSIWNGRYRAHQSVRDKQQHSRPNRRCECECFLAEPLSCRLVG